MPGFPTASGVASASTTVLLVVALCDARGLGAKTGTGIATVLAPLAGAAFRTGALVGFG